jgi:hypothetical protein
MLATVTTSRRRGATEQAFERAVVVARRAGRLDAVDGALVAAGRASARPVDDATLDGTVWMREAAIRRHVETPRELQLTPGSRAPEPGDDPFTRALATSRPAKPRPRCSDFGAPASICAGF